MRKPVTFWLSAAAVDQLHAVARALGVPPEEVLESGVRRAAEELGLPGAGEGAFLELEAVEEMPAIGPEGRGRRVRLKAIDETGEMDVGELFVGDEPRREDPED